MNFTPEQEQIIIDAQNLILVNQQSFGMSGPETFIRYEISKVDQQLARAYWNNVCVYRKWTNPIIIENNEKLSEIKKRYSMPEWGYKGT